MTEHQVLGTCQHCGNDDATHLLALCSDCAFAIPDPSDNEEHAPGSSAPELGAEIATAPHPGGGCHRPGSEPRAEAEAPPR
jgi:hypothetical protein